MAAVAQAKELGQPTGTAPSNVPPAAAASTSGVLPTDISSALAEAQDAAPEATEPTTGSAVAPVSLRPAMRPEDLVNAALTVEPENEVVTRISTSGGHQWGVNVGRFNSRYLAERALVTTALTEMDTLDGTLRKVVKRPTGFDANFLGMSRDTADLACRRLTARNIECATVGPS